MIFVKGLFVDINALDDADADIVVYESGAEVLLSVGSRQDTGRHVRTHLPVKEVHKSRWVYWVQEITGKFESNTTFIMIHRLNEVHVTLAS